MDRLVRVLYICYGNSCRSQIAEAWTRNLSSDRIDAYSAGINAHGLNRVAVKVMAESGIDISHYRSKTIGDLGNLSFDYAVVVCGCQGVESLLPESVQVIYAGFDNPPELAKNANSEEEAINHYRRVRDEIKLFVQHLPERLEGMVRARDGK